MAFIIPFFCVFAPEIMLGQTDAGVFVSIIAFLWVLVAVLMISMSICGFTFMPISMPARFVTFGIGILMVACAFFRSPWLLLPALGLSVAFFIHQFMAYKSLSSADSRTAV